MPEWALVNKVEASPHDPATAYVAVTRYKFGDYRPYLWKTEDYGETWQKITSGISDIDFTRVIKEDPQHRGVLYAGTEGGVYVSIDAGASWQSMRLNMPPVPIHDLVVKDSDLVAGTYGRGFWILDDLTPLHQITEQTAQSSAHLFQPRPAYRLLHEPLWRPNEKPVRGEKNYFIAILGSPMTFHESVTPQGEAVRNFLNAGTNPPEGVIVTYYLGQKPEGEVTLNILDGKGQTIKSFSSEAAQRPRVSVEEGANRFVWDMRYPGAREVPGDDSVSQYPTAPLATPGTYQAQLVVEGQALTQSFEIHKDPRIAATQNDLEAQFDLTIEIRDKVSEASDAVIQLRDVRRQMEEWEQRAEGRSEAVVEAAKALKEALSSIEGDLVSLPRAGTRTGFGSTGGEFFGAALISRLADLTSTVGIADWVPTQQSHEVFDYLSDCIDAQLNRLKEVIDKDVAAFVELVHEVDIPAIVPRSDAT